MSTNNPMTQERLDAIQARVDGATTSPWDDQPNWTDTARVVLNGDGEALWDAVGLMADADSEFIAHAREDVPALLTEVERLHDELAKARAVTEDKVEVACKAFYEAGADKLDDTISPQWDHLVRVSPDIAQVYREHVSAALAALLGGGQA